MTHTHGHPTDAAAAARAQRDAPTIGTVANTPIPRTRLDERVRDLRTGHLAARLPTAGSKEDRQFLRWTAQVLLTEELCRVELARMRATESALDDGAGAAAAAASSLADASARDGSGSAAASPADVAAPADAVVPAAASPAAAAMPDAASPADIASPPDVAAPAAVAMPAVTSSAATPADAAVPADVAPPANGPAAPRPLTQAESLHLGSINAAAWSSTPAMSALYDLVTEDLVTEPSQPAAPVTDTRPWYRVTHSVAPTALEAATATPTSLGWTTLDDLPAPLAAELRAHPPGSRVGPVHTTLGWHVATITATESRPAEPAPHTEAIDPTRLAAFNRWLDERRHALVTLAPGFEHPGDPSQPDNTHRH